MELNKKGSLLIEAHEKEIERLKENLLVIEKIKPMSELHELQLELRKVGIEGYMTYLSDELEKFKRLRELEIKSKSSKNISKDESIELLKTLFDIMVD